MSRDSVEVVEGWRPGAIGRVAELHGVAYAKLAGFGVAFESLVAREFASFCERFQPGRDGLWLAMVEGRIEGSIAIQSAAEGRTAHLRWFLLTEAARGQGIGRELLGRAIGFCRASGVDSVDLWTFAGLDAARRLYETEGFVLVDAQRGSRWGSEVEEQCFTLTLDGPTPSVATSQPPD